MTAEKIEAFWENATADDVAKIVNTQRSIVARFRDEENEGWVDCQLVGWKLSRHLPGARWIDADGAMWNRCQVYREPSWHADRPDPGPGWILLKKFPDEELKPGDEAWSVWNDNQWRMSDSANGGMPQGRGIWYRRRIEPVGPNPKRYILRVGDSVETPSGHVIEVVSPDVHQMEYNLKAGCTATLPNGQKIKATEKGFEVTQ